MKRVLMVVTSHENLGSTGRKTGYYLSELTHPYFELVGMKCEMDFASPKGGKPPLDERSFDLTNPENKLFFEMPGLVTRLESSVSLGNVVASAYDGVFIVGGHGAMWDLGKNAFLDEIISRVHAQGGVIGAVCHGVAGLLGATRPDGTPLVSNVRIAGFTNEEESAVGLTDVVPFLLETELRNKGADFQKASPWKECVVTDDRIVTGQNPASAAAVGREMASLLSQMSSTKPHVRVPATEVSDLGVH